MKDILLSELILIIIWVVSSAIGVLIAIFGIARKKYKQNEKSI